MKNSYRKALCTSVLVLVLVSPAFAGDIQHPVAPPPPPTASGDMHTGVTDGVIHTDGADSAPGDALTEIALSLAQSLLTLF